MGTAILSNGVKLTKHFRSKMDVSIKKKEFSMIKLKPRFDFVTAKQRLSVPFSYRLLKFKVRLFGLSSFRGLAI